MTGSPVPAGPDAAGQRGEMPEDALVALLHALKGVDYRFVAVTPATHARVLSGRRTQEAADLRDAFGWNLPFRAAAVGPELLHLAHEAEALVKVEDGLFKSRVRVASLDDRLFFHSAYPTDEEQSVFFGPDTYRFASFIEAEMAELRGVGRIVDLGAGSGAGGMVAAGRAPGARLTFSDINPAALRLAAANAACAGVKADFVEGEGLDAISGPVDLIVANPPYMMDDRGRAYRDGGAMDGAALSLEWALAGGRRLDPGGRMLLYTGVAIADGRDRLRESLERQLPALDCALRYRELDPDVFGEELEKPSYAGAERIAVVGAVIARR